MAIKTCNWRDILLTQGGADAFVQATEPTGISPSTGIVWLIKKIELFFGVAIDLATTSADWSIYWALSSESNTATPTLADRDTIYADGLACALTTSGQPLIKRLYEYTPPDGVIVVDPYVYATLDSNATALTLVGNMRVYYEEVKVSEIEILRMLSQG